MQSNSRKAISAYHFLLKHDVINSNRGEERGEVCVVLSACWSIDCRAHPSRAFLHLSHLHTTCICCTIFILPPIIFLSLIITRTINASPNHKCSDSSIHSQIVNP
ncbi:hypothetical protein L1887_43722 [Cichorium endivia]|nr:hypothetical protein L1887_43722 [Cichorium endivia]